mmetsp:Transcript_36231/g.85000  ORF Transcript_36231/g.85000 Transcript_36231/m.85000 type:complete len:149 (-) Transcript_36231:2393-2839(-)
MDEDIFPEPPFKLEAKPPLEPKPPSFMDDSADEPPPPAEAFALAPGSTSATSADDQERCMPGALDLAAGFGVEVVGASLLAGDSKSPMPGMPPPRGLRGRLGPAFVLLSLELDGPMGALSGSSESLSAPKLAQSFAESETGGAAGRAP